MTSHELFSYHSHMELERQKKPDLAPKTLTSVPGGGSLQKETVDGNSEGYIGVLEVYIHQARDIHNICIYHKQDVYAKLCLTSDPDISVSTQIINGGGKNPVFNQTLQLKVRTVKSSLKCEVWMLSRVKNYLEDQLLGFSLVPLSDILVRDGKLMREFSLSSTDLFHSPAGFLQLSLSYFGSSPEVLAIPAPPPSVTQDAILVDSEADNSLSSEYTKIEFPDPNLVNENQIMVSEYFGIPCSDMDSHSPESLLTSENNNGLDSGVGVHVEESFSHEVSKSDTPVSSLTNGFSDSLSVAVGASSQSLSDSQDQVLLSGKTKDVGEGEINSSSVLLSGKTKDVGEGEINSSSGSDNNTSAQPVINVKIETEQQVVQQDIVDMYMKSMQQFTESLAKMKLPMDIENGGTTSANGNSSSDSKSQKKVTSSRVFYGSRAFF